MDVTRRPMARAAALARQKPPPDIQNHGTDCTPRIRSLDGGQFIEFRWEATDVPGRPVETETPSWVDTYGWVQVSDFASWKEVARWAARLFAQAAPDEHQPLPEELDATVETIRALPARPAQAIAALRYVQDNYRYLGIEIGENSHQPYPVATVCERRFGDCKDKANLLSTLLRLLGFEADPALVETDYRRTIADWHPTPYAFDHAVVRLRLDGRTYWLDPTREHQGGTLGHVYFPDYGKALVVREDTETSRTSRRRARRRQHRRYGHLPPGALCRPGHLHRANGLTRLRRRLRARYFSSNNREQIERNYLNYYAKEYPKIRALGNLEFADDREKNEIVVNERYEVADFWGVDRHPEDKQLHLYFEPRDLKGQFNLPATRIRTMPFAVGFPDRTTQTIRVILPETPDVKPEHVEVKDKAFAFDYASNVHPAAHMVTATYRYEALADTVEAVRMPEYLANAQRALDQLGYSYNVSRRYYVSQTTPARSGAARHPLVAATPSTPVRVRPTGDSPRTILLAAVAMVALLPVGWVFMRNRKREVNKGGAMPPPLPLHYCAVCGRTDVNYPDLDFRVGANGLDYCANHSSSAAHRLAC